MGRGPSAIANILVVVRVTQDRSGGRFMAYLAAALWPWAILLLSLTCSVFFMSALLLLPLATVKLLLIRFFLVVSFVKH